MSTRGDEDIEQLARMLWCHARGLRPMEDVEMRTPQLEAWKTDRVIYRAMVIRLLEVESTVVRKLKELMADRRGVGAQTVNVRDVEEIIRKAEES